MSSERTTYTYYSYNDIIIINSHACICMRSYTSNSKRDVVTVQEVGNSTVLLMACGIRVVTDWRSSQRHEQRRHHVAWV